MTPRRQQTAVRAEQPVRFYKLIALSFLFLTIILLGVIVFMSTKRATITIESKSSPVDIRTSVVIGNSKSSNSVNGNLETVFVELSEQYQPTGTEQEPGIATGVVTLHNETSISQPLVRTTRLVSEDGILFRLTDGVTVPAEGTIETNVYADKEGAAGDIGPDKFTIPGLREDKQKVIYATSDEAMSGGVKTIGILSQEDLDKAQKQLKVMLEEEGQRLLADKNPDKGVVFSVIQNTFTADQDVGEQISGFGLAGKATVLAIFYDKDELNALASTLLGKRAVDDTEIVEASGDEPTLTIEDYDLESGMATVQLFHSGTAILNPESKQLEKGIFYGKTRDEARRYILKLDHVSGVDIKFSPAWMQSVPHIADHVNVVVKSVE